MAYLKYLEYWKEPEYARFIVYVITFLNNNILTSSPRYPSCLQALTLILQNPAHATKTLKDPVFCEHLLFQQRCTWQENNTPPTENKTDM